MKIKIRLKRLMKQKGIKKKMNSNRLMMMKIKIILTEMKDQHKVQIVLKALTILKSKTQKLRKKSCAKRWSRVQINLLSYSEKYFCEGLRKMS